MQITLTQRVTATSAASDYEIVSEFSWEVKQFSYVRLGLLLRVNDQASGQLGDIRSRLF